MNQVHTEVFEQQQFSRSPITQALIDTFRACRPGETLTYEKMSEIVHLDVTLPKNRHYLQSARAIAMNVHGVVFVTVRHVGIKRLLNDEIAKYANEHHRKLLVEDTRRYAQKVDAIDYGSLEASQRNDYWMARTFISLRQGVTSEPVEKSIKESTQDLQPKDLIDSKATIERLKNLWK